MTREHVRSSIAILFAAAAIASCADEKFTTAVDAGADAAVADGGASDLDAGASADGALLPPKVDAAACPNINAAYVFTMRGAKARAAIAFPPTPLIARFADGAGGRRACPMALDPAAKVPYRSFLVQNATGVTVQLSAWAVCKSTDDAFLAFYDRTKPPVTNLEVAECAGYVSEGAGMNGETGSPEANGAVWCPGLTVANGGALELAPCASALVLLQNYKPEPLTSAPGLLHIQVD